MLWVNTCQEQGLRERAHDWPPRGVYTCCRAWTRALNLSPGLRTPTTLHYYWRNILQAQTLIVVLTASSGGVLATCRLNDAWRRIMHNLPNPMRMLT